MGAETCRDSVGSPAFRPILVPKQIRLHSTGGLLVALEALK